MAPEIKMKRHKAHQTYRLKDGTIVPGVTTVLNILDKPALVNWANNLGLEGIKVREYVDTLANVGTLAHDLIEAHYGGDAVNLDEYSKSEIDLAQNSVIKWFDWAGSRDIEPILIESPLVSEEYRYGGTVDIYATVDGIPTELSIKTSKGIYPEMRHQSAAYRALLAENSYPCEQSIIVRVGRDEKEGFETEVVEQLNTRFRLFVACLQIRDLKKELGER